MPNDRIACPACAAGLAWPLPPAELADDPERGGELVERCCDGLLIARRRRPWWAR